MTNFNFFYRKKLKNCYFNYFFKYLIIFDVMYIGRYNIFKITKHAKLW